MQVSKRASEEANDIPDSKTNFWHILHILPLLMLLLVHFDVCWSFYAVAVAADAGVVVFMFAFC